MNRRELCLLGPAAVAGWSCSRGGRGGGACAAVQGQTVRWVIPYSYGGTTDVLSRFLETPYERELGAEIQIVTDPGGGGLVGASRIAAAQPNGRTLGILQAAGLLAGALSGQPGCPHPLEDFTVLARLIRTQSVLVTGPRSSLKTAADLIGRTASKPLLFAVSGAAANNLLATAGVAQLLGLSVQLVSGYPGIREVMLALMRGEVDLAAIAYETLQPALKAGELRGLLQFSAAPFDAHPAPAAVELLGGENGWAAKRAGATGRTRAQAIDEAQALEGAIGAGVIVVAPPKMDPGLRACLTQKLDAAIRDAGFLANVQQSRRTLDIAIGGEAEQGLRAAAGQTARFVPALLEMMARLKRP